MFSRAVGVRGLSYPKLKTCFSSSLCISLCQCLCSSKELSLEDAKMKRLSVV